MLDVLGTVGNPVSMFGKRLVSSEELEVDTGLGVATALERSSDIEATAVV